MWLASGPAAAPSIDSGTAVETQPLKLDCTTYYYCIHRLIWAAVDAVRWRTRRQGFNELGLTLRFKIAELQGRQGNQLIQ